ncbi:MAG TPA: head GIN domain-containing protein [Phototrophicaceae bacterium]|nr:head GIN domain-containing protein [Phototrophicaceae bacterium]
MTIGTFILALIVGGGAFTLALFVANAVFAEQGSGKIITETRQIGNFNTLALEGIGDLTIVQGTEQGLTIETDDNIVKHITTEVKGDTLFISYDNRPFRPSQSIRYTLRVKNFPKLLLKGDGKVTANSITTETLAINLEGRSEITLAGSANTQVITIKGDGKYQAQALKTQDARVSIEGLGTADIWAEKTLDIQLSGASKVTYYGTPRLTQKVQGMSTITQQPKN